MAEGQNPDAKRRRIDESMEEDTAGFRAESPHNGTASGSSRTDRRLSSSFFIERLLRFATKSCTGTAPTDCAEACRYYRSMDDPSFACSEMRPEVKVSQMLSFHEKLALVYLSESVESFPEETALAFELLEASWFENENPDAVRNLTPRGPRLKYFRMAQSIRNKHGISRKNPFMQCFNSFEDITKLEKALAEDDPLEFMLQCVALSKDVWIDNMYSCTKTHWQLKSFHQEISRMGRAYPDCVDAYAGHFEDLSSSGENIPTWCQVESYLNLPFPCFSPDIENLFHAEVPRKKLDEALRRVLSYLLQCFGPEKKRCLLEGYPESQVITPAVVNATVHGLRRLLQRGASLDFREPQEFIHLEQSSLGALIELADVVSSFPLAELEPYICCPLTRKRYRIEFDKFRPARLSCLAARSVRVSAECSEIPGKLRSCLRMHQDLKSQLENEHLRIALIGGRVLGETFPMDNPNSADPPAS